MAMTENIFFVGIAGASGCGKTHLATLLKTAFLDANLSGVEIISSDNYYKPYPGGKAPDDFNWDVPESIDLPLIVSHLSDLRNGKTIDVPKYDFLTSQREPKPEKSIDGQITRIVILEGLFVLTDPTLRAMFNLKIFTWLEPDICLARRLVRDVQERGYSFTHTIHMYQTQVKPAYVNFIEPTKKYADIIVSTSEYTNSSVSLEVIKSYVLGKVAAQGAA
jgi:uridine kinase